MGQYYKVVNVTKKQYLHPHRLGAGLKLCEFSESCVGELLLLLLAGGNGRGGGDLPVSETNEHGHLIGSWAGDKIVVAGDCADGGTHTTRAERLAAIASEKPKFITPHVVALDELNLYDVAEELYEDISDRVVLAATSPEAKGYVSDWVWEMGQSLRSSSKTPTGDYLFDRCHDLFTKPKEGSA